ncbi:uncharacterized protein DEA37_0012361, partial [Paragonimus westermani]
TSADFTQHALKKSFCCKGAPAALVTNNDTQFTVKFLVEWIKGLGFRCLFTALQQPQSDGLAENFVRALHSATASITPISFVELDRDVANFLI